MKIPQLSALGRTSELVKYVWRGAGGGSCSLTLPPPLPHPSQYHLTLSLMPARDPGKLKAAENGLAVLQICSVLL